MFCISSRAECSIESTVVMNALMEWGFRCIKTDIINDMFSISIYRSIVLMAHPEDTGYPHDGRADNATYRHDRRADKRRYPHDREIDFQLLKCSEVDTF